MVHQFSTDSSRSSPASLSDILYNPASNLGIKAFFPDIGIQRRFFFVIFLTEEEKSRFSTRLRKWAFIPLFQEIVLLAVRYLGAADASGFILNVTNSDFLPWCYWWGEEWRSSGLSAQGKTIISREDTRWLCGIVFFLFALWNHRGHTR